MQQITYALVLYANVVLFILLFIYVYRRRKIIGFQLGMNIAMSAGGMLALTVGILLIFQYPFHFTWITILATIIGMLSGALFGALFDYQTMLTGIVNGFMLGIMAPMLGAILNDPFFFVIVLELLVFFMMSILVVSIWRS
ncbi:hypothetical protein [Lentibacillus sp. Marseille-P4043]|uniref:hypothetical protein n=1 Tax=Lentibacillus sp. Marseille-P4043 TaxID=2040293 RepID=UPI000D0BA854|nr:hypothetical protein [Lentibacillus sp. Marseille-P4043]